MARIPVFLDTSVVPRHPGKRSIGFRRLCELAQQRTVKVYVPAVVLQEWTSQWQEVFEQAVRQARKSVGDVVRHPWSTTIQGIEAIRAAEEQLEKAISSVPETATNGVKKTLDEMRAEVIPVGDHHGKVVIEAYFRGASPFRTPKHRNDFPDAFIFECAMDLVKTLSSELHCVVADGGLRASLSQLDGISVHESIDSFVRSDRVVQMATQNEREQIWRICLKRILESRTALEEAMARELPRLSVDELAFSYVSHSAIPDDNGEAFITTVGDPTNIVFDWNSAKDYGNGAVGLPFEFECVVEVGFRVFRADAYGVPEEVWVDYRDPEEHHYFDPGGSIELLVEGTLGLIFDFETVDNRGLPSLQSLNIDTIKEKHVVENVEGRIFL